MHRRRSVAAAALTTLAAGALLLALPGREGAAGAPLVVSVSEPGATGAAAVATGFAVAPARVVTVAHVLEPGRRLVVRTDDDKGRPARVLRVDRTADLALIAVPGLAARPYRLGRAGDRLLVRRGGRVTSVPAAIRRRITATVRGPDSGPYIRPALELRASVVLGDSGAPVVDASGAVAGVLFAQANDRPATAYAVDAGAVARLLH